MASFEGSRMVDNSTQFESLLTCDVVVKGQRDINFWVTVYRSYILGYRVSYMSKPFQVDH